ncbi:2-oxoacid:acceptor oxidoreductase family protein [Desulfosporosinus lacus]|uniref:Pyruvate ferredoxin oxidoreductase gamma subunit n=1 Tax=Desulfosporosinus lacus DSM 15449 TaxID=1121420 RepID=A0A1M6C6F7_9FIRM|nr:2-oxoacid:acceptor oxidoreductase family protein [Desulfosporosinus lacus]SHI56334.1 pyruvate ferredoxin oxidoreductase gamma subunit [Desulfosporosinus lacus DSM 15449]
MTEIRFHGRFGQPVGKLVRVLGKYALGQGKNVQVFDSFAAFRPGAPMYSILRVSEQPIRVRSTNNTRPDTVVILDNSLFSVTDVTKGLKSSGKVMALGVSEEVLGDKANGFGFVPLEPIFGESANIEANFIKLLQKQDLF